MPLIYSHCEWRCQKTIQLIFGRGQKVCEEDRINTKKEKERKRRDRLGDVNTDREGKRAMKDTLPQTRTT